MAYHFINEPFGVVWGTEIIWFRLVPIWEQHIIVRMIRPKQADMESRVNSSVL